MWQDMQFKVTIDSKLKATSAEKPCAKYLAKNTATLLRSNDITQPEGEKQIRRENPAKWKSKRINELRGKGEITELKAKV